MATGSHDDSAASTGVATSVEASLLDCLEQYLQPEEREQVARAFACVGTANATYRASGNGAHSLDAIVGVLILLAETSRAGPVTLAAALLFPFVARGALSPEAVQTCLGSEFAQEVLALTGRMRALSLPEQWSVARTSSEEASAEEDDGDAGDQERGPRKRERKQRRKRHAELLRDLLLLAREEPRIAAWKLAERLYLMDEVRATAERLRRDASEQGDGIPGASRSLTIEECTAIAVETRESYAPVASHLGMRRLEAKLHDHAFAVLQPDEYQRLSVALAAHTHGWQPYLDGVCAVLSKQFRELGIEAEVFFRRKAVYSIYQKLKRIDSTSLGDLYDLLAVRIITENAEECYLALDVVHTLWSPIEGRVKDYIAAPKKNGYRSLHTTVRSVDERTVEVQIRTRQMHILAEYGMHWLYKSRGDTVSLSLEESEELAAAVLQHQERIRQAYQPTPKPPSADEPPHDHLHVYTPDGLLKTLPRDATVLDFAFHVHMEVGWHASGAQVIAVGGVKKPVMLDDVLQGGETVEILTRDTVQPTYAWLSRVQTKKARGEIIRYLRTHNCEADLELLGRERVDEELRALGIAGGLQSLSAEDRAWLVRQLNQSSLAALLVALASDKVELSNVSALLRSRLKVRPPSPQAWRVGKPAAEASAEPAEIAEVVPPTRLDGILTRLANCCHPLPSDTLLGYITRGSGIAIHRADCPNIPYLRGRFPERVVAVEWPAGEQIGGLHVHIIVEGREGAEILREVMAILERHHVTVVKIDPGERHRSQRTVLGLTVEIQQLAQLHRVLADLRAAPEVIFADRQRPHAD